MESLLPPVSGSFVSEIHPLYIEEIDIQNPSFVIGMKIHPFEIQLQISSGQTGTATTMVSSHEVKTSMDFFFPFSLMKGRDISFNHASRVVRRR